MWGGQPCVRQLLWQIPWQICPRISRPISCRHGCGWMCCWGQVPLNLSGCVHSSPCSAAAPAFLSSVAMRRVADCCGFGETPCLQLALERQLFYRICVCVCACCCCCIHLQVSSYCMIKPPPWWKSPAASLLPVDCCVVCWRCPAGRAPLPCKTQCLTKCCIDCLNQRISKVLSLLYTRALFCPLGQTLGQLKGPRCWAMEQQASLPTHISSLPIPTKQPTPTFRSPSQIEYDQFGATTHRSLMHQPT